MDAPQTRINKKKDRTVVTIEGAVTVERAAEFRTLLLQAFERGKNVELVLSGLTEIDVSGLQLLCSCHRSSVARGVGFVLLGCNETLHETAALAGMYRHKGCLEDTPGTCLWLKERDKVTG